MRFEIEFLHKPDDSSTTPAIVRRNSGQFASEADVEVYALHQRPAEANFVRVLQDGVVRRTIDMQLN